MKGESKIKSTVNDLDTRNVSKNDEQHFLRTASWRSIGKLYGWLHNTSQDHKGTRRNDNPIFEDSREAQPVFQKVKIQLQHGRNSYFRSGGRQRTDPNGIGKSIQRTQGEDHKSASIGITKEKRKIQSENRCLRTCYRRSTIPSVTNFIQLVSPQPVDRFSQTKLHWKAPNEGYLHICGRYKSGNKWLRYQDISSYKSFVC